MRYAGVRQFGGLSHRGQTLPLPRRPWINDLSVLAPYEGIEPGDIPSFSGDPDWSAWALADTPDDEGSRLRWHVIEDGETERLIADRMILVRISWGDLDAVGFVTGAPVIIDGERWTCRLLTGGDKPLAEDPHAGGAPTDNEWDVIIGNRLQLPGLPQPPAPRPLSEADHGSVHNRAWHWLGAVSWTAEPLAGRPDKRVCRGYHSGQYFYVNTVDHRHEDIGWRPVLERAIGVDQSQ